MKLEALSIAFFMLIPFTASADTKMKLENLPAAVQAAVKELTRGAVVVGVSKEVEGGRTTFEVETTANGKTRDLEFEPGGKLLSTEEEVDIADIPLPAKQAIEKKAQSGSVKKVERVTAGSSVTWEAVIQKGGRKSEFVVNADGSLHR